MTKTSHLKRSKHSLSSARTLRSKLGQTSIRELSLGLQLWDLQNGIKSKLREELKRKQEENQISVVMPQGKVSKKTS